MRLFLDTEFTALQQDAQLISLALVSEDDRWFYAEFTDYDADRLRDWHRQNVIAHLFLKRSDRPAYAGQHGTTILGEREQVAQALRGWLDQYKDIEIWADVPAYDWVLFCELFGGALQLPEEIFYQVYDLATLLKVKGLDPDADRTGLAPKWAAAHPDARHNALYDALLSRAVFASLQPVSKENFR